MKPAVLALTFALAALTGTAADAQVPVQRPDRPYRGLFGGGSVDWQQSLTASSSLGGGFDDNVLAGSGIDRGGAQSPLRARRGEYGYGVARLAYALARPRVTFGASATGTSHYYPGLRGVLAPSYAGSAALSVQALERTRLTVSQTVSDRPYNLLQFFPAPVDTSQPPADIPDEELAVANAHYVTRSSAAEIGQTLELGRRSRLGLDYGYRRTYRSTSSSDIAAQRAGAVLAFGLTRGLGARLGYRYQQSQYLGSAAGGRGEVHSLIAGIDYNRRLSVSRRTTLSFSTGSSAVTRDEQTRYRATGNANLTHEMGRTWSTSITYDRGVAFIEAFDDPLFYDSATAALEGLISRRVQFRSALRASLGHVGISRVRPYDTYSGVVGLNVAITRYLAAGTSYLYYRYQFDAGALLPAGVAQQVDRQGVRAYISVWAPLFYRVRTPDATR